MEKYSFIDYIKSKEHKYFKCMKILESAIEQYGGDNIDIKKIQSELLKIKKKLDDIKNVRKDGILDPYDKLKELIDGINLKITSLDKEYTSLVDTDQTKKEDLINKINEINILLENTTADYTTIKTDKKLQFYKEKIEPEVISKLFDKYIDDTQLLVDDLKIQLGEDESLIDNDKISESIKLIETKRVEYKKSIQPILKLKTDINQYIKEMESLYTDIKIDENIKPFIPLEKDENNQDKIKIESVDDSEIKFSYFDTNLTEESDEELVNTNFLNNPNLQKLKIDNKYLKYQTKYQFEPDYINLLVARKELNNISLNLYKKWSEKMKNIQKNNQDILEYEKIQEDITFNKLNLEKVIKILEDTNIFYSKNEIIPPSIVKDVIKTLNTKLDEIINTKEICDKLILEFKTTNKLNQNYTDRCAKKIELDKTLLNKINKEVIGSLKPILLKNQKEIEELKQKLKVELDEVLIANLSKKEESVNEINNLINELNKFTTDSYKFTNKYIGYLYKVGGAHMNELIVKLNEFEKSIRNMKNQRKEIIKLIKYYNIRYTQFFNFQKYVVNYVSLVLAKEPYEYYQYIGKNTISFYKSILQKIDTQINKFEDPSYFTDKSLDQEENRLLYTRHYFMIKILKNFFEQLDSFWETKFEGNRQILTKRIKTEEENGNKKYFFLFNIFFKILDAFSNKLKEEEKLNEQNKINEENKINEQKEESSNDEEFKE